MNRLRNAVLPIAVMLFAASWTGPFVLAQEADEDPAMVLESVAVEPSSPAVDTLCRLRVTIRNDGSEVASQLGFKVTVNGVELPVYRNQLFMYPVPPGETVEVPLYNFWSTETSRPAPRDGKLRIEVELSEAEWMEIEMEEDVEVWTPLGAVDGLPVTVSRTLALASS